MTVEKRLTARPIVLDRQINDPNRENAADYQSREERNA
jgi:hypothetical protein